MLFWRGRAVHFGTLLFMLHVKEALWGCGRLEKAAVGGGIRIG